MTVAADHLVLQVGIIVGLLSTGVQSLGLTLQRKSHILEDEKDPLDVRRPPHRRRRWQLGMGMFIISNVLGSTVQISTLPLPVLSTLQASGLVFNSICASLILAEPFTRWSLWGTLLVTTGAVLIAVFGAIPSPAHTLDELLQLLGRKPFVVWMSLQALLVIAIAVATDSFNAFSKLAQTSRYRLIRGLAYGCISGILSAHSLLVAKSAVELIVRTIVDGNNQFNRWQSWMLVIALVTLALSQLYYLHRGLKLVSTSVLYPLVFCIYNIIAILDGLIYFNQTDLISPLQAGLISLGTVILLSGVLSLSWRLSDEQHPPAVGQSTLAPGLGLVEDTEGEEEEEDLLLGSDIAPADEESVLPRRYSYQTFGEENGDAAPTGEPVPKTPTRKKSMTPSIRTNASRWTERAEIWDELEDQDPPRSPALPVLGRRRSSTLPVLNESQVSLPPPRRGTSGGNPFGLGLSGSANNSTEGLASRRGAFRKRRRSTGFRGFQARRTTRQSSGGLQELFGGIWRSRWFGKNKGKQPDSPADATRGPDWPPFRDDPDEDGPAPEASQEDRRGDRFPGS
jgi:magnesium transporter